MGDMTLFIDMVGVSFFAIAGALAAGRKHMDLFGVIVLGCVTAIGGGTVRDIILGAYPVFWVEDPRFFLVAVVSAIGTFALARRRMLPVRFMMYADAAGLAVFTVLGFQKGFLLTQSYGIGIIMGVMTGVVGGIIRDVLSDEIPLIFRREIYASASLSGAIILALISHFYGSGFVAIVVAVLTVLTIRLVAIRWNISLPVFALDAETARPPSDVE